MVGKHYNWHKRWKVDIEAATAVHESGLVARFHQLPITDEKEHEGSTAIGKCWTPDGREWGVVTTPESLQKVFGDMSKTNGERNAQQMIARLAREAGETWVWHKSRER